MSIWDNVLEEIKSREGGVDKFLDDLYAKSTKDESPVIVDTRRKPRKQLTLDELIDKLKEVRKLEGGDIPVYMEDSSGYDSDVCGVTLEHRSVVLTWGDLKC